MSFGLSCKVCSYIPFVVPNCSVVKGCRSPGIVASTRLFPECCALSGTGRRDLGLLCSGRGRGLHSPRWPAESDKPPLFPGRTRVFRPQAWPRAQLTGSRSPQDRPVLWLRENAGLCPCRGWLGFLGTFWEEPLGEKGEERWGDAASGGRGRHPQMATCLQTVLRTPLNSC